MSRLQLLLAAEQGMSPAQKAKLENYFVGALSILADEENWMKALDIAKICMEKYGNSEEMVTRG